MKTWSRSSCRLSPCCVPSLVDSPFLCLFSFRSSSCSLVALFVSSLSFPRFSRLVYLPVFSLCLLRRGPIVLASPPISLSNPPVVTAFREREMVTVRLPSLSVYPFVSARSFLLMASRVSVCVSVLLLCLWENFRAFGVSSLPANFPHAVFWVFVKRPLFRGKSDFLRQSKCPPSCF